MEKFALLNLLKALETLSPADKKPKNDDQPQTEPETANEKSAAPQKSAAVYPENNVMASVLSGSKIKINAARNTYRAADGYA